MLSAGDDYTLKLWDVGAALAAGDVPVRSGPTGARFCRFAPERRILIATDSEIAQVDAAEPGGSPARRIPLADGVNVSHGYDPDRGLVAIGRTDEVLHVYSVDRGQRVLELDRTFGLGDRLRVLARRGRSWQPAVETRP